MQRHLIELYAPGFKQSQTQGTRLLRLFPETCTAPWEVIQVAITECLCVVRPCARQ